MKIITISGLDGSGKSTQVELLKNYLESQGKRVFYFHAVQFSIGNKFLNFPKNSYYTIVRSDDSVIPDTDQKSVAKTGWLGIWLRKIALKIDIARFKKLLKKLEKDGYDYILSDRYFYDGLINIEYLKNSSLPKQKSPLIPLFQRGRNIPKPDLAIYLQVDPEIIMQRERKPDQGIEYLNVKKKLYDETASKWNLKVINGNRPKEIIFDEIIKLL